MCNDEPISVAAQALTLKRVTTMSPTLKLLASSHAPVILVVIGNYFNEGVQRLLVVELYEHMVQDFRQLNGEFDLPLHTPAIHQ